MQDKYARLTAKEAEKLLLEKGFFTHTTKRKSPHLPEGK